MSQLNQTNQTNQTQQPQQPRQVQEQVQEQIKHLGNMAGGKFTFDKSGSMMSFSHDGAFAKPKLGKLDARAFNFDDIEEWFKDPAVQKAIEVGDKAILSPGGQHDHSWESFLKRSGSKSLEAIVKKGMTSKFDTMSNLLENTSQSLINVGGLFGVESAAIVNANIQVAAAARSMGIGGKQATYPNLVAQATTPEHRARVEGISTRIAAIAFAAISMYESDDALGGATGGNAATLSYWYGYEMGFGKKVSTPKGEMTVTASSVAEWRKEFATASYKQKIEMAKETLAYSYKPPVGVEHTIAHCYVLMQRAAELEDPNRPAHRESSDDFNPFDPDNQVDVLAVLVGFFRRLAQGLDEAKKFDAGEAFRFVEYLTTSFQYKQSGSGKIYDFEEGYDDCGAPSATEVVIIEQLDKLLKGADGVYTPFGEFISRNLRIAALHALLTDEILARGKKADENESAKRKYMEESMCTMVRKRKPRLLRSAEDQVK